ncbi:putative nuclease HARBI1 [Hydractinia symbiolongicarpus]|uniref:putative nuclease HARBI1 n=1 Tax=Hydractinia symbiolongicarpus TaxID=13093 RepID=UPI00254E5234|nr:putative nuclease HARBI1 [Hydractinia symbiolongicarpus]
MADARCKQTSEIKSKLSLSILVANSLLFQIQGVLYLSLLRRNRLIQNILTYFLTKRRKLLKRLKHQQGNPRKRRSVWFRPGRTDQWWINTYQLYNNPFDWKKNFRMSKEDFNKLCDELRPFLTPESNTPNHRALSLEKKVAVVLYFLKDTGSIWMTANSFGIHQCTVSKVVKEVCAAITMHLTPKLIKLPETSEEMYKKASEFELKYGMVQAFGCIDGTHIPIKTPGECSQDYFNYKQFFSLNVQAVCDFRGMFMDVDCRWPGSCHDAKVFANSMISKNMKENLLPITHSSLLPGYERIPNFLIGDPAYPLLPHCMKEYESCKTNSQVIFNVMLRCARNPIESAFGRLKGRWGILTKKIDLDLNIVPLIVMTCFTLHNFCEINTTVIDEELVTANIEKHKNDESLNKNIPDPIYSGNTSEGHEIRSLLTEYINQNLPDSY